MSDRPDNLNDYAAWLERGNIKEALDALKNQVTYIIGNEQTAQMLVKKLGEEQAARDKVLGDRLEQTLFSLKTSLNKSIGTFEEQAIARLDAYGTHIDALSALVEERTRPFSELAQRVGDLEYGYAQLADRVDAALNPETPGATFEMVVLKRRVDVLVWLLWAMFVIILFLAGLLVWHHYFIWERLR